MEADAVDGRIQNGFLGIVGIELFRVFGYTAFRFDIPFDATGTSANDGEGRNVSGNNISRADHCVSPNRDSGKNGAIGADGCAALYDGGQHLFLKLFAAGILVVGKCDIGSQEDIVFETNAIMMKPR